MHTNEQKEMWVLTRKINECWYNGQLHALDGIFDDNVIFNSPDFKHQIVGKENCIQTYIDFLSNSKILLYNESKPIVQMFGSTSIVTYDFEMKYEQNTKTYHETGTDILIYQMQENSWKVIWRALSNLNTL
ncbi:MAG: nuclear transport factor 2 family protein [Flavipsychrobacter sp.]|nr:nuclear transport factor 2 family protein [Flavipsychrobacter sp.]